MINITTIISNSRWVVIPSWVRDEQQQSITISILRWISTTNHLELKMNSNIIFMSWRWVWALSWTHSSPTSRIRDVQDDALCIQVKSSHLHLKLKTMLMTSSRIRDDAPLLIVQDEYVTSSTHLELIKILYSWQCSASPSPSPSSNDGGEVCIISIKWVRIPPPPLLQHS